MAPDLQRKGKFSIMEYAASKDNGSAVGESDDKPVKCASNYAADFLDMEMPLTEQAEKVNIGNPLEHIPPADNPLAKIESDDATENSSSFGNTASGDENESMLSDDEVISKFNGDHNSLMHTDGSNEFLRMRKKKLSAHWKAYTESLRWRCKWVELQISRFRSEALRYDLLLEKNKQRRQFNLKGLKVEDFGAKSLPFPSDIQRIKVMKREKRKRDEDTVDKVEYMERHKLFSYFGSKGYDVASIDVDSENIGVKPGKKFDGKSVIMSLETDDSMEELLWKIGAAQSNVGKQKDRLDTVMSGNAEKMSFALSAFPPNNGDKMLVGSSNLASLHIPENNTSDLIMTENEILSHGEVTKLPDVSESTEKLVGTVRNNLGPEHLMDNRVAKEDVDNLHEVQIEPVEVLKEEREEQWSTIPSDTVDVDATTDVQPSLIVQSVSKVNAQKKKRRGRWKANKYRRLSG